MGSHTLALFSTILGIIASLLVIKSTRGVKRRRAAKLKRG
jgi:hypothetical protein